VLSRSAASDRERRDVEGIDRWRPALLAGGAAVIIGAAVAIGSGVTSPGDADEQPAPDAAAPAITSADVEAALPALEEIVAAAMDETGVPGIATAVVYDDEVVFAEGAGVRAAGSGEPVTPETIFEIASLSKPISSTVVAGAVGEDILGWDDPVVEHDPDFALSDPLVGRNVTVADLFAHRSGLPGQAGNELEAIGVERDEIIRRLRLVPLGDFRSTYSYSNFGLTAGGETAAIAAG
jgi:CubicO group peptidase (beta-lactamase class C family)